MEQGFEIGDRLRVRTLSGAVVERIVVGQTEDGPLIVTPEEFAAAKQASREPQGVGWPAEFIVGKLGHADGRAEP